MVLLRSIGGAHSGRLISLRLLEKRMQLRPPVWSSLVMPARPLRAGRMGPCYERKRLSHDVPAPSVPLPDGRTGPEVPNLII